jgi:hypothetical protein
MIKVFDITTKQYYPFNDYVEKFSDSNKYGEAISVESITNHSDGLAIYCPGHNFFAGQPVALSSTTNYDGTYSVVRRLSDDYVTIDGTYVATEDSGYIHAYLNNSYHIAFMHDFEDMFDMVKEKTAYLGSRLRKEGGDNLMNEITIVEDDENLVEGFMRTVFYEIARMMQARSKSIINGFQFNATLDQDADGTHGDTAYLLWMMESDEDNEFRDAYLTIDEKIKRVVEAHILKEWFRFIGQDPFYAQWEQTYQNERDSLRKAILASEGKKRVQFYQRPTF